MSILSVCQTLSTKIGIARPTVIYGSTDRDMLALQGVIADAVLAIKEAHDWQKLKAIATMTGDATKVGFDLPTDYDRMLKTASLWSSRYLWAMNHILDSDKWLELLTIPYTQVTGSWTIYGDQVQILDTMATGDTAKFFYIKNLPVVAADGTTFKPAFTIDSDVFRLNEDLLRLAIIYKWKQAKQQSYEEEMNDFNIILNRMIDKDGGGKPIVSGRHSTRGMNVAWPGTISGVS
ncbi:hypothetical protein PSQ19_06020 [Devosia algicola]|uniref:Uncharacterized protein n=1 Tax=Devosia algicola TaxID=3026418 RepID=A0ABY7YRI0_9HYPH|nr:hypothetical protein [Devosia algicola]WDR03624.1 hypothetical protein PSQ19_06020 [Devosia algicola]